MLLATDGHLSPLVCAVVYCDVISACCRVQEMVRAREWTAELTAWCARNPQARAFNGQCLVHRAEVMQLEGDWAAALEEARKASEQLQGTNERTAIASAAYRRGETCRLQGRFANAEKHYREASEFGRDPQPSLALLRRGAGTDGGCRHHDPAGRRDGNGGSAGAGRTDCRPAWTSWWRQDH
jgi:tetratricopeptide (TPR) repeat protein